MTRLLENLKEKEGNYIFPFFWQHGEDADVLREYMRVIDEANCHAVCVESRPHPDFLGPKWWQDMDVILDEARKRQMKVWILDDSHFPTGYCNGAVRNAPNELRRQSIYCKSFEVKGKRKFSCSFKKACRALPSSLLSNIVSGSMNKGVVFDDDRLLSVTAQIKDNMNPVNLSFSFKNDKIMAELPVGTDKVYITFLTRNAGIHRTYMNMMEPASCRILIDTVYEPHWQHYREDFGTTIAGFFSDEPELGNGVYFNNNITVGQPFDLPWSGSVEKRLPEKLGKDWKEKLPLLWYSGEPQETARVRYLYMDTVTRLVEESFSRQLGQWCEEHGVRYIGHIIEDGNAHARTANSLGHYFRGLSGQHMAGIDDIGGQVIPFREDAPAEGVHKMLGGRDGEFYHFALGKLAASAAALDPGKKGNSMCEIFGNYGWMEGPRYEKYLADHFMVQNINHFVPHAFSPKTYPDKDCPPHFYAHGHNPQYRAFGCLMKYMNRVCHLTKGAVPVIDTAILYHGELEWAGEAMLMQKIARVLMGHQQDFLFLPCDVFEEPQRYQCTVTKEGIEVNGYCFKTLLVPACTYIPDAFAMALSSILDSGCRLMFVDKRPDGVAQGGSLPKICEDFEVVPLEQVSEAVEKHIEICPANSRIRAAHYRDEEEFVYLVNEDDRVFDGEVCLPFPGDVLLYDPWENQVFEEPVSSGRLHVTLRPEDALILAAKDNRWDEITQSLSKLPVMKCYQQAHSNNSVCIALQEGWKQSAAKATDYPEFGQPKAIRGFSDYGKTDRKFSGYLAYDIDIPKSMLCGVSSREKRIILEITEAGEDVEVFVNGKSQGIQVLSPFYYDLTEDWKEGANHIRIEVATTLERENGAKPKNSQPTGITGEVNLFLG